MENDEVDDQALRIIALEHAIDFAKNTSVIQDGEEVVKIANSFYIFLKGMTKYENVQTASH